jgi:DNA primase
MIVVEGYFDAIALHQAGLANTVATSGTALTTEQARLLKRTTSRVALTYDGDAAGREAMMRSLGVLLGDGLEVVIVDLPTGDDPDTLVRRGGAAAWQEARHRAADPIEFVQRHVLRAGGAGDPRERALQAIVALGAQVPDPIRLELLFQRAEQVLGIAEAVLHRALGLRRSGQSAERPLAAVVREQRGREQDVERLLLRALLQVPEALDEARQSVGPDDFHDPQCAAVARWLRSGAEGWPGDELADALARELAALAAGERDWQAEARGATRLLVVRRLRQRKRERELELRRSAADPESERRLMHEIDEIARSLRDLSRT